MQEDFLQYLWKYGLFPADKLFTPTHERVEILTPGQLNSDAGPDFLMARIRIGEAIWAGHVEIHVKASDWYRHNHHEDPAYDPVVLHVVYEADCSVKRANGDAVPTVVLPVKPSYLDNYHQILSTISPVPCEKSWRRIDSSEVENWIVNMGIERMQSKSTEVFNRLARNKGGWEETWFQLITRSFGFGINQDSFDRLGQSIPLSAIRSSGSNLFRLEAILFGQAGLIPVRMPDPYSRALMVEYNFVRQKFNLVPMTNPGWKFLRMRPTNFPTVRIAQLAAFFAGNPDRLATVLKGSGTDKSMDFSGEVSAYWKMHYDFGKKWEGRPSGLGAETINLFLVNAVLPFRASYAHQNGDSAAWENWMDMLGKLPAEKNRITRIWLGYGYRIPNAFYSQAFLHLFTLYCHKRHCLTCHIGQFLIRGKGC
jgi:hypothetical protein